MSATVFNASQIASLQTKRFLQNLEIESNSSNPTYQVDINSGLVGMDDGSVILEVSSPITVDITASGANGLDTGSEAVSTWYYIYLIYNPTTDTIAGLFSVSASSPTMPSGYTKKRLISAVYNDSGGDFATFLQQDADVFYLGLQTALAGGTATSWTSVSLANFIPSDISRTAKVELDAMWGPVGGTTKYAWIGWSSTATNAFMIRYRYAAAGDYFANEMQIDLPLGTNSPPTMWYLQSDANSNLNIFINGFRLNV